MAVVAVVDEAQEATRGEAYEERALSFAVWLRRLPAFLGAQFVDFEKEIKLEGEERRKAKVATAEARAAVRKSFVEDL
ncbi:hypothetical protein Droror1_Dr00004225 [Drosera rotundifolia]